jgi:hypothetical protein
MRESERLVTIMEMFDAKMMANMDSFEEGMKVGHVEMKTKLEVCLERWTRMQKELSPLRRIRISLMKWPQWTLMEHEKMDMGPGI